jgi:hypothetical protein
MTIAHTARKQNKNVLAFLTACCEPQTPTPSLFDAELADGRLAARYAEADAPFVIGK